MALFQQSVLKKYINDLNNETLQAAWLMFQSHFHNRAIQQNILNAKEEEYQEGFVRDLFVNVLGFTLKPQPGYNLVMEQKSTSDATKSDGAILSAAGQVLAVIELKDTNSTDLYKVEKQAFGYKHQHKDCVYVITANFEKLRLYINDAIDFEEFDLFMLSKERFALLYCCLQHQALHNNVPLQMKQQSVAAEENITKKLYADYSRFKKQLFGSITQKNPQYDKLELFKKTQKLLDRFLFILFAEDRLLLPPNSVREILQQWEHLKELDNYVPLYERFKKYFGYLNTGYQGKQYEIFAYNGGLFAADEILDNIIIDDQLLFDSCRGLSNYDFESEVDVNILGHIFEHSLSEIEEVERQLSAAVMLSDSETSAEFNTDAKQSDSETSAENNTDVRQSQSKTAQPPTDPARRDDRKISKRKKDGVFYTPRYITKYIVENTLGSLCTEQKEKLLLAEEEFAPQKRKANAKQLLQKLDDYRQWLLQLTICDPACGSGAFLNQALEFLIAEHRNIDELKAKLFGDAMMLSDVEASILENNLFGVDINDEATEIARLSLWLRTARKGRKLNNLNQHIKCGNSLIHDPAVAGDKAFNWEKEFPQVFAKGGFDVVIGNPPYVRPRSVDDKQLVYFKQAYAVAENQIDLYQLFIEKANTILNDSGSFSFIVPNAFLANENSRSLRSFILKSYNIKEIVECKKNVFEDADVESLIFVFKKSGLIRESNYSELKGKEFIFKNNFDQNAFLENKNSNFIVTLGTAGLNIYRKIKDKSNSLSEYFNITTGIKEYQVGKGNPAQKQIDKDNFVFNASFKKDNTYKPELRGKNVSRYLITWSNEYISYGEWLAEPRDPKYFVGDKILIRQIPSKSSLVLGFTSEDFIIDQSTFIAKQKFESNIDCKYALACLNSKLTFWIFRNENNEFDELFPKIKAKEFKSLPIINLSKAEQFPFIVKADIMLSKNKELQQIKQQLMQLLQGKYEGLTLSKKLQDWPSLSFKDYLKELDKQKIKLSLPEQAEWMQYFEAEKKKANAIQLLINTTDKEIDNMVYALYGLTEEEIRVVEGEGRKDLQQFKSN